MSKMSEIHEKLTDFGYKIEALTAMPIEEALELLNKSKRELKDCIDPEDLDFYYEQIEWIMH